METSRYNSQYEVKYLKLLEFRNGIPKATSNYTIPLQETIDKLTYIKESYKNDLTLAETSVIDYITGFNKTNLKNPHIVSIVIESLNKKLVNILEDENANERLINIIKKPNNENLEKFRKLSKNYEQNEKARLKYEEFMFSTIYECMSSIKRVLLFTRSLTEIVEHDKTVDTTYTYKLNTKIKFRYKQISTELLNQLQSDGYVEETSVGHFRSLFSDEESYSQYQKDSIIWLKPYNTLTYFIKKLQGWFINDLVQQKPYEIAIKRFYNKDGQPFKPKKVRHDKDPNPVDKENIDNIIDSIKISYSLK